MALIIKDRVKEITTTTGTGAVSLGGASATFDAFQSVMSNGDTTFYAIVHTASGTDEWEVGLGTWNTGNTLTRTTVYAGSNGTSAVNFSSGNKDIFMTYPASKAAVAGEDVTFADITATDITSTGTVTLSADPSSALQAATKQYVDTIAAAGIHYHAPVRVEHPSNLNATYNNGSSGVGATLTNAGTNAALVLDNVSMVLNDRVLVANQTDQTQNGVYTVTTVGDGSTAWVLTRSTDTDSYAPSDGDSLGEGDAFFIKEGDTNAGHLDVMSTSGTITFGTTNIVFSEVAETSIYSAGTGLTLTGTTFSTNQDISTSASPTFNNITVTGTVDGRDVATDGSKLDGIEAGATADQTAAEIKTAYESNSNTNAFTDAEKTKLSGIETGATGDQTASEILTAIKTVDGVGSNLDADLLDGQQGSYYLNTGTTFSGDVSGTYNNIVVANDSHTHDGRYYTETEADSRFVNVTGDTMSGTLTLASGGFADQLTVNRSDGAYYSVIKYTNTAGELGRMGFTDAGVLHYRVGTSGTNQNIFHDSYHPNADKWTTARTLTLSGDASGSVSWDGSANATLSVTVADDSHNHTISNIDNLSVGSLSGMRLTTTSGYIEFGPANSSWAHIYTDRPNFYFNRELYVNNNRVYNTAYHPEADKWTTARTLTLSGDASGSVSWDGSANATLSVTVANDSHTHLWSNIAGNTRQNYSLVFKPASSTNYAGFQFYNTAGSSAGYFLISGSGNSNTTYQPDGITLVADAGWLSLVSRTTSNTGVRISTGATSVVRQTIDSSGNIDFTGASFQYNNNNIWHAGNDGSGSGLDADLLDGYHLSTTRNAANTVPVRDGNGYLQLGWINTTSGATTSIDKIYASADNYIRYVTPATFRSQVTDGYYLGASSKAADSELLDGIDSGSFVRSDADDSLYGNYIFGSSGNIKIRLKGSSDPMIMLHESNTERAYMMWDSTNNALRFRNLENDYFDFYTHGNLGGIALRLMGADGDRWGSIYATDNEEIGFLDEGNSWVYKITNDSKHEWSIFNSEYMELNTTGLTLWHGGADALNFALNSTDDARGISFNGRTALSADYNDGWLRLNQQSEFSSGVYTPGRLRTDEWLESANGMIHQGDTDTGVTFNTNEISLTTGGSTKAIINSTGVRLGDSGNGYFRPVSGNYGSIEIDGGAHGNWEGYGIGGRIVFMHDNNTATGIFNDVENEWLFYGHRNGYTRMYYNGSTKVETTSTGVTVTGDLNSTSDIRYKKNIETIDNALEKVQSLRGVTYDWDNDAFKEDDSTKKPNFTERATGVIAQDVEKVLPEAVRENEDGFKNVAYGNMVGLLIEAIKEQQEQIDALKKQIDS